MDAALDNLKEKSINAFNIWESLGKPRQGNEFFAMRRAKLEYKNAISKKEQESRNSFSNELNDALIHKDMNTFWKSWKSKMSNTRKKVQVIEGHCTENDIAASFKSFFEKACTPNTPDKHLQSQIKFESLYPYYVPPDCNVSFSVETVDSSINLLKKGKAPGVDNLTAEHLLYSHPILVTCLTQLFNLMLQCGYVPDSFGTGIMIPLLKGNDLDATKCENYRGLTLSPVMSKLFEYALLEVFSCFFYIHLIYSLDLNLE